MQSSHFPPTAFPSASAPPSVDRFPNASRFAPIFAGREAPTALPNASGALDAAFFSEFEPSLVEAARRLTAPTAEVLFERFGFATLDDFARNIENADAGSSETLLFSNARDARFLLIAPTPTFRLLFDAALGFDVAALCANEALWSDFNADAQTPSTSFEREAFAEEAVRWATLSPFASLASSPTSANRPNPESNAADAWRVSFASTSTRAALELDDALFYWERRFVRLAGRLFPWTVVFSARQLASLADSALPCASSNEPFASSRLSSFPEAAPPTHFTDAFYSPPSSYSPQLLQSARSAEPSNSPSSSAFELAVVVERGEMARADWRRLKPGDILTTNVPANALFLGLVDDSPRFLCRPGLFRGAAAVQIQGRADDDRE